MGVELYLHPNPNPIGCNGFALLAMEGIILPVSRGHLFTLRKKDLQNLHIQKCLLPLGVI